MEINCSVTALEAQKNINSTIFYTVKAVFMCVSCTLNTLLSVPLLLVIMRSPSLLSRTRFLLLTHLLMCDNLQQLFRTIQTVLIGCRESLSATQCLIFRAAFHAFALVDLLLSTALAVDRFVAIRWPLHYEPLLSPTRKRAAVAAIWTLSAVLTIVPLCIGLRTIRASFSVARCRAVVLPPCLSRKSALALYCTVKTMVILPLCFLIILGCFCLLCWDMRAGLLCTRRACVTMMLQVAQTILFSVPVVLESYLIPSYLHNDAFDIATTLTYNLGVSLIPLVYGYRSRELQQRIQQVAHRYRVTGQSRS